MAVHLHCHDDYSTFDLYLCTANFTIIAKPVRIKGDG